MTRPPFKLGDRVIKNPATWQSSEFDGWGAGLGVGVVVLPLWDSPPDVGDAVFVNSDGLPYVDVRWPKGRSFQRCDELLSAPDGYTFHEFEHMGYVGLCQPDPETGQVHGRVYYISDVVTFRGATTEDARLAFDDSVEDYLEMCAARGEEPESPEGGTP